MINSILSKIEDSENDKTVFYRYENKSKKNEKKFNINKIFFSPNNIRVLYSYKKDNKILENLHILNKVKDIQDDYLIYEEKVIYHFPKLLEKNKSIKIKYKYKNQEFKIIEIKVLNTILYYKTLWRFNVETNENIITVGVDKPDRNYILF